MAGEIIWIRNLGTGPVRRPFLRWRPTSTVWALSSLNHWIDLRDVWIQWQPILSPRSYKILEQHIQTLKGPNYDIIKIVGRGGGASGSFAQSCVAFINLLKRYGGVIIIFFGRGVVGEEGGAIKFNYPWLIISRHIVFIWSSAAPTILALCQVIF